MRLNRRALLLGSAGVMLTPEAKAQTWSRFQAVVSNPVVSNAQWQDLPIGGGGLGAKVDINPSDGTRLFSGDTQQVYIWEPVNQVNKRLITQSSFPANQFGFYPATGPNQIGR